jgi:tetratricopeptide (TPR) repeat protein
VLALIRRGSGPCWARTTGTRAEPTPTGRHACNEKRLAGFGMFDSIVKEPCSRCSCPVETPHLEVHVACQVPPTRFRALRSPKRLTRFPFWDFGPIVGLRSDVLLTRITAMFLALILAISPSEADAHTGAGKRVEELNAALLLEPNDPDRLLERAGHLVRLGRLDAALKDLDAVQRIDGSWLKPHPAKPPATQRRIIGLWTRAMLHRDAGRTAEAEADLDRLETATGLRPEQADARARLRSTRGAHAEALNDWRTAMTRSTPDRVLGLGAALEALGRDTEATEIYQESLQKLDAVSVRIALISALARLGRVDAAIALVDEQLASQTVRAAWLLRRGDLLATAGRRRAARADWKTGLAEVSRRLERRRTPLLEALHRKLSTRIAP